MPELYQAVFFDIECKLQKCVILWTFFYINCFSHSLYLSRARNISCFSCFLTIVYAIYMPKLNTSEGNGKQKRRVIRKRLKKESGAECRGDA